MTGETSPPRLYCADERHGMPCELPCDACAEECDGTTTDLSESERAEEREKA
jgi:hypothetical protein